MIAIIVCAVMSFIIGSGLMALAFFSSKYGFDEKVDHDLESLIDIIQNKSSPNLKYLKKILILIFLTKKY